MSHQKGSNTGQGLGLLRQRNGRYSQDGGTCCQRAEGSAGITTCERSSEQLAQWVAVFTSGRKEFHPVLHRQDDE